MFGLLQNPYLNMSFLFERNTKNFELVKTDLGCVPVNEYMDIMLPTIQPYSFIAFWFDNQERKKKAFMWKNIKAYKTSKEGTRKMQIHSLNAGEHSVTLPTYSAC